MAATRQILRHIRTAIRKLVFGNTLLPQEFTIGLNEPQTLTTVWLHGIGAPIDVTQRYTTACCAPFLIGIAVDLEQAACYASKRNSTAGVFTGLSLQFRQQTGEKHLLGEIHLALTEILPFASSELLLCHVRGASNYCLPVIRRWAHYLRIGWAEWRRIDTVGIKMSFLELRAAMITFIRPHPLALVSVSSESGGNIFPMNLMGDLGNGYFAFALKDSRLAAHLIARIGRLAISNVPLSLCPITFALAINHTRQSIDWSQLPFKVRNSATLNIPVPVLAPRVREMEVENIFKLGSHNLFIAKILSEEFLSENLQVNVIHGFYQFWRFRSDHTALRASLVEDTHNKQRS